jgi:hypothetical protein
MQVTAVPACIEDFKASPESVGVNIIGLVSHAGISMDRSVAEVVTGVGFIVSGHSHTKMFPGLLGPCLNFTGGGCECDFRLLLMLLWHLQRSALCFADTCMLFNAADLLATNRA